MKKDYIKIINNDPTRKARITTRKLSDTDYEIIDMYVPMGSDYVEIGEELLREVTADADKESVMLHVDINKILSKKDR